MARRRRPLMTHRPDYPFLPFALPPPQSTNQQIYDGTVKDICLGCMKGHNVTVFAYGATGSGKTYTMVGSPSDPGMMVLSLERVFRAREGLLGSEDVGLTCSYIEVYNEVVYDLLVPKSGPLELREDPKLGVCVAGIKRHEVSTPNEIMGLLNAGNARRKTDSTDANATSSRSHAVLEICVTRKPKVRLLLLGSREDIKPLVQQLPVPSVLSSFPFSSAPPLFLPLLGHLLLLPVPPSLASFASPLLPTSRPSAVSSPWTLCSVPLPPLLHYSSPLRSSSSVLPLPYSLYSPLSFPLPSSLPFPILHSICSPRSDVPCLSCPLTSAVNEAPTEGCLHPKRFRSELKEWQNRVGLQLDETDEAVGLPFLRSPQQQQQQVLSVDLSPLPSPFCRVARVLQGKKGKVTRGKLCLVDLAGSERGAETNNMGQKLRDGANINKSLLALANCINALGKASRGKGGKAYVPYRNSKLTRLLKDGLSGNCKTAMIATVSASADQYMNSINTLKYADRAKEIKTSISSGANNKAPRNNKKAAEPAREEEDDDVEANEYQQIITGLHQQMQSMRKQLEEQEQRRAEITRLPSGRPDEILEQLIEEQQQGGGSSSVDAAGQQAAWLERITAQMSDNTAERINLQKAFFELEDATVCTKAELHQLESVRKVKP